VATLEGRESLNPVLYRYSRWDGSQDVPDLDADQVLDEMAEDILAHGDLQHALRRLTAQGLRRPDGGRLPGLRDLLRRVQERRRDSQRRHDLGSSLEDIRRKLDRVVAQEKAGIRKSLPEGRDRARRERRLEALPRDPAGQLRQLQDYDFVDPEARRGFEELLEELRGQALTPFMQGLQQGMQGMTPEDLRRMGEMVRDLNRLLRERAAGREPDFEPFRQKWGQHFPGAQSLDDLLEQLAQQQARMQSLLRSLSGAQRQQLEAMMRAVFAQDERLEAAMAELSGHLREIFDWDQSAPGYPFEGQGDVSLDQALRLMDEMHRLDDLEAELRGARSFEDLEQLRPSDVERLIGEDAARDLRQLQDLARRLEEAGYLEQEGDELRLTARAIRKIADRALADIFRRLQKDRFGGHALPRRGGGGDPTDESKPYEFGDPFLLDVMETVRRAVERDGPGTPVRLAAGDFAVRRTEARTRAATVVMVDMSRSMLNSGYFLPAKKMALALSALIRGQYPRDALYIVGFSLYAREFKPAQLPTLAWTEWNVGTNMHAGFALARRLLARHAAGTRQILMVTDGEPTAHLEPDGVADFNYPPTRRTIDETLREVQRCTRERIVINTFMLEETSWLAAFVDQMTRLNRGRAFYTAPDRLGEYVLVDYVTSRQRRLA
jgi:uncharacterized protein with von Willebrand factor type A (vWA) domain